MKILMIGGSGLISSAVLEEAVKRNIEVTILNRGKSRKILNNKVEHLIADINDDNKVNELLNGRYFDSIIQWISYTVDDVKRDIRLFYGHTKQFIFISSASAYQKPLPFLPITEKMPLGNPYWQYSKNKQLCEEYLLKNQKRDFKVTIVRPSHTFGDTSIISQLKSSKHPYTLLYILKQNKQVIIPGDGMQLWTLTYNRDFASGFVDILGNKKTYGKIYHLTSDKVYTWERIMEIIADALGVKLDIVYIPWDFIFKYFPEIKPEILGDKQKSLIFDNKKIRKVAKNYKSETGYEDVIGKIIENYETNKDLQTIDKDFLKRYEKLIKEYREREK